MGIKFANNAYSTLASGITDVATSISVQAGHGARFPAITGTDYFYCTLIDSSNNLEIVKVTARSTDTLTVTRGAESTTARAYLSGDRIELRVTAAALAEATAQATKGTAIASAGTVTIPDGVGYVHITGTTTITDIDFTTASDGRNVVVVFDGALTLTHNSTTLKLPGAANITTAANDRAWFFQDDADNVICVFYAPANGSLPGLTATVTELNYIDGVTSNIQTQLDGKEPSRSTVSQAEAEAGTATTVRGWTAQRVAQAIAAQTNPGAPIPTSSSLPVGWSGYLAKSSVTTVANGSTHAGSNLEASYNSYGAGSGTALSGTWKNITGASLGNSQYGLWVRTA